MVKKTHTHKRKKKKKNNNNILVFSIIIAFLMLIVGIFLIQNTSSSFPQNGIENNNKNISNTGNISKNQEKYYIGDKVLTEGKIENNQNIGFYTHLLTTKDGKEIGIKSRDISLNKFSGKNIKIKGEVEDIRNNIPIVEVTQAGEQEIENFTGETSNTGNKNTISHKKYFGKSGIYFDFSTNTGIEVKETSEGEFLIYKKLNNTGSINTGNISSDSNTGKKLTGNKTKIEKFLTISPFKCNKASSQNCNSLKNRFERLNFESFVSTNGVKFYNIVETNKWIFFNNDLWGYYVYPQGNKSVLELSKYINLIEKKYIKEQLSKNIGNICKNEDLSMKNINSLDISFQNENIIGTLQGKGELKNNIQCILELNLGETIFTKLKEIKKISNKNTNQESSNKQDIGDINLNLSGDQLEFTSKRGFTIVFPTKNIAYMGEFLEESTDLNVSGLSCNYKVNVVHYQNEEKLDENPGIEVFQCKSTLDEKTVDTLIPQGFIYKKSKESEKEFLIKTNNSNLEDIAKNLEIY